MKITDATWQVEAENEAEKRQLFERAAACGLDVNQSGYEDDDLFVNYSHGQLWADPHQDNERELISVEQFAALCEAYR